MAYYDTPLADINQDVTQPQIRTNFQQANTSFGIDHYSFDNGTANNGFHLKVTTPDQGGDVATTTNPIFFAKIPSANIGLIQFSRGPSSPVICPVTFLQSSSSGITIAPSGTSNVLDFTGLTTAIAELYACDPVTSGNAIVQAMVIYSSTGPKLQVSRLTNSSNLVAQASGSILQLSNSAPSTTFNNVVWTLQFLRLQ